MMFCLRLSLVLFTIISYCIYLVNQFFEIQLILPHKSVLVKQTVLTGMRKNLRISVFSLMTVDGKKAKRIRPKKGDREGDSRLRQEVGLFTNFKYWESNLKSVKRIFTNFLFWDICLKLHYRGQIHYTRCKHDVTAD